MRAIAGRLGGAMVDLDTRPTTAGRIRGGTRIHPYHIPSTCIHVVTDFVLITSRGIAIPRDGIHRLVFTGNTEFSVSCEGEGPWNEDQILILSALFTMIVAIAAFIRGAAASDDENHDVENS